MNKWTSVLLACLIVAVVGGSLWVGLSGGSAQDSACKGVGVTNHSVVIRGGKVSDADVTAKFCDTLTITNRDAMARQVAFGVHGKHVSYGGLSERVLAKGQSLTVTLKQTGRFHWHDHLHDEVEGYFTVN